MKVLIPIILVFIISCTSDFTRGQADAKQDIENNILRLYQYGELPGNLKEIQEVYSEKDIQFVHLTMSETNMGYCNGYNDVMQVEIGYKYGVDFKNKFRNEARALYEQRRVDTKGNEKE